VISTTERTEGAEKTTPRTLRTPREATTPRTSQGAALVLVLVAVAILVPLAFGAGALVRARAQRVRGRTDRAALRDAAESALALELWRLEADTNAVDALSEPWAERSRDAAARLATGTDGVFVLVEDERSRLGVPDGGERALAALFQLRAGLDEAAAAGEASSLFAWMRERAETAGATNLALSAEERLLDAAPERPSEPLEATMPLLSAHAGGTININTAGHDALVAAMLAGGATRGGAEGVWLRLEMSRARGDVFRSTAQTEALKLLRGEGDIPSAEEIAALQGAQNALRVDSGLFRVRAIARRAGRAAAVECVYERGSRRILRWLETTPGLPTAGRR
jgi:type II secretory pathway component PulK